MQWACAILSSVACPALHYFSTLSHNDTIFGKKKAIEHEKRVYVFRIAVV